MRNTKPVLCDCCKEVNFEQKEKIWLCKTCGAEHAVLRSMKDSHALVAPSRFVTDGDLADFQVFFHRIQEGGLLREGTFHVSTRSFFSAFTFNHRGILHLLKTGWELDQQRHRLIKVGGTEVAGYTLFYVETSLIEKMIAAELLNPDWSLKSEQGLFSPR